ncbi:hypothetical protein [Natronorubrum thiooxidans]|uniref:hypothetical protein n=1 Tax=Natronorubrum thiooxidans TaxID=308853 RepID=UPI001F3DEB2B|nr:hypothetical protein [Natronorubrum thiooxidans]
MQRNDGVVGESAATLRGGGFASATNSTFSQRHDLPSEAGNFGHEPSAVSRFSSLVVADQVGAVWRFTRAVHSVTTPAFTPFVHDSAQFTKRRSGSTDYVRELERENQLLGKALQQATRQIEKSSQKDAELGKILQESIEDSSDELPQLRLDKDETEEALASLEETVDEAIERMDEVGRW